MSLTSFTAILWRYVMVHGSIRRWRDRPWLYVIGGFRQSRASYTGLHDIWASAVEKGYIAQWCQWNSDWHDHAVFLARRQPGRVVLAVVAYSWGVGYGLRRLARCLTRLAGNGSRVRIPLAILLDPVAPFPQCFFPGARIVLPSVVDGDVHVYRQRHDRFPRTSRVVVQGKGRLVVDETVPGTHLTIDDDDYVLSRVDKLLQSYHRAYVHGLL